MNRPTGTKVEASPEGQVTVTVEDPHITVREFERRMGRVEKGLIALVVAVASPKLGGPDPSQLVSFILGA